MKICLAMALLTWYLLQVCSEELKIKLRGLQPFMYIVFQIFNFLTEILELLLQPGFQGPCNFLLLLSCEERMMSLGH